MMSQKIQDLIRSHSIDNLRVGTVISKDGTTHVVRIGTTEIIYQFSGSANVGQLVTLECPDGDLTKAYILAAAPIGIGEGGMVEI
jgi:hypothetical protein